MNQPLIDDAKLNFFQFAILLLSIIVLGALVADTFLKLPAQASRLLTILDTIVCGIFLVDFAIRLRRAESKLQFMKWGWIDLLASIPSIDLLRWGRMIRVLRIIRILRAIRSVQKIASLIFKERVKSGYGSVVLTTFLLIFFSSIAILLCEQAPESNIKTAEDALWWSVTTITTVGYGDKFPFTTEGRVVAMLLMISGVGLFGTLSGLVASSFLGKQETELSSEKQQLVAELARLNEKLDQLRTDGSTPSSRM